MGSPPSRVLARLLFEGWVGGGRLGLVVVPRFGEVCGKSIEDQHVHWATAACEVPPEWPSQAEIENFSSTKVRNALLNNDNANVKKCWSRR